MKLNNTISSNPVDDLCQMPDELCVIGIALGNEERAGAYPMMSGSAAPAVEKGR